MMRRRDMLLTSSLAAIALPHVAAAAADTGSPSERDFFELRQYHIENETQRDLIDTFMREAAIPALNRTGIKPVGVFYHEEDLSPIYVLLRHASVESLATATHTLLADEEFLRRGADFLDAPASSPAYTRVESSLMVAFDGMPRLETPVTDAGRIFQLRIYESPSVKTGQKKIEMFNIGEMAIFRKTGLHPVFFGELLLGAKMPNLTYMLVFKDQDERKRNWRQFVQDPEWQKLSAIPEYADDGIVSDITNIFLKPAAYSQI